MFSLKCLRQPERVRHSFYNWRPQYSPEPLLTTQGSTFQDEQMLMEESYSETEVVDEYGRRIPIGSVGGRRLVGASQGRLQRTSQYGSSPPQVAVRLGPRGPRRNSAGQLILEPEECLSDKEIYPRVSTALDGFADMMGEFKLELISNE